MFSQDFCKHWDQVAAHKFKVGMKILWKRIIDMNSWTGSTHRWDIENAFPPNSI